MYVLIIEDDPVQASFIERSLEEEGFNKLEIERIATESQFNENFVDISRKKPDIIIMDIMLRWADPSRKKVRIMPSEKVKKEGFYRAGIRCVEMLTKKSETQNIPIIIYSVLDRADLDSDLKKFPQAKYVVKDFDAKKLMRAVHSMRK